MKHKKILIFTIAVIALGVLWALFRPDLLFANKKTEDPFPDAPEVTAPGSSNADASSSDAAKKPSAVNDDKH